MLHFFSNDATRNPRRRLAHSLFVVAAIVSFVLAVVIVPQAQARPLANDFTIQLTSQNTLWVDANKCNSQGPQAAWLSFWITNPSGSSQSDVTVVLSGLNGTTTPKIIAAPDRVPRFGRGSRHR